MIFDELGFAQKMHDTQSFIKSFNSSELGIYGRWLKLKKLEEIGKDYSTVTETELEDIEKYIESALIDFSTKHYEEFNYTRHYKYIDKAVESTRDRKLLIPIKTPITKKEYDILMTIENERYRRIVFVMLVVSKYFKLNNTSMIDIDIDENTMFFVGVSYKEAAKMADVRFKDDDERTDFLWYINDKGFVGRTKRKKLFYVKIIDTDQNDENVVEWITDYDHINLHYERLFGESDIGVCEYCGCLFRKRKLRTNLQTSDQRATNGSNSQKFCYKHRGYNKKGLRFGKCIDCGKEFYVDSRDSKKTRCDECQSIRNREVKRRWKNGHYRR